MHTTNLDDTLSMAADPSNGHHAQNFVVDATTQTDEFDYINCNSKPKPCDKDYFENDDKPDSTLGCQVLKSLRKHSVLLLHFVDRRSTTLDKYREIMLVLMKLRINVPHQDLSV